MLRILSLFLVMSVAALFAGQFRPNTAEGVAAPRIASQVCLANPPGTVSVELQWESASEGTQWIDLSLFDNGFAQGSFIGVGPLEVGRTAHIWDGLLPDRVHFIRVNTLTPSGWQPSGTTSFRTADCVTSIAATIQGVGQACEGSTAVGTFFWQVAAPSGTLQWLDLSLQDNGFAPGTFVSSGPLDGHSASSFVWHGLLAGKVHYWRVNTWTGSHWLPSGTGVLRTDFVYPNPDGTCGHVHADPGSG